MDLYIPYCRYLFKTYTPHNHDLAQSIFTFYSNVFHLILYFMTICGVYICIHIFTVGLIYPNIDVNKLWQFLLLQFISQA